MKSEREYETFLNELRSHSEEEFVVDEEYFDALQTEIEMRIKTEAEFAIPKDYLNTIKKPSFKTNKVRKLLYFVSSSAAVLLISFFVFSSKSAECKTFDCLLEETSISAEDLEYYEEYEEINLFDYEE